MLVSNVMIPNPTFVHAETSLHAASEILRALDVRHLPVVDDDKVVIGMLSDRDLPILYGEPGEPVTAVVLRLQRYLEAMVADHMSSKVISISAAADVTEVLDLMLQHRIGAVPVLDQQGRLEGIVSYVDLLRELRQRLNREE